MNDSDQRIDLRFGEVAVSLQGFVDPVQPMKQVLRFVQRLVEETPEISRTPVALGEAEIEALLGDLSARTGVARDDLAAAPGLIVTSLAAGTRPDAMPDPAAAPVVPEGPRQPIAGSPLGVPGDGRAPDPVWTARGGAPVPGPEPVAAVAAAALAAERAGGSEDAVAHEIQAEPLEEAETIPVAFQSEPAEVEPADIAEVEASAPAPDLPVADLPVADEPVADEPLTEAADSGVPEGLVEAEEDLSPETVLDAGEDATDADEVAVPDASGTVVDAEVKEVPLAVLAEAAPPEPLPASLLSGTGQAPVDADPADLFEGPVKAEADVAPDLESEMGPETQPDMAEGEEVQPAAEEPVAFPFNLFKTPDGDGPSERPPEDVVEAEPESAAVDAAPDETVVARISGLADREPEPEPEGEPAPDPVVSIFAASTDAASSVETPVEAVEPDAVQDVDPAPEPVGPEPIDPEPVAPVSIFAAALPSAAEPEPEPEREAAPEPEIPANIFAAQAPSPAMAATDPAEDEGPGLSDIRSRLFGDAGPAEPVQAPARGPRWIEDPNEPGGHDVGAGAALGSVMARYRERSTDATEADAPQERISPEELAERAGAETVPEMLCSSAAWLTLVEQRSNFGRREVMEVFDRIPGEHPRTLEARIKGFGKLVRSGSVVLVDDGRFALSSEEKARFRELIG